jgi:hypothetical protein
MKYKVIQKIKAFGLQVGDVFEEVDGTWCREYKNGTKVCVPERILIDHPDWFMKININKKINTWPAYTSTWTERPISYLQLHLWYMDVRGLLHGIYLGVWALVIVGVLCLILK